MTPTVEQELNKRPDNRLSVRVVGIEEPDGVVRLDVFSKLTQALLKTLASFESELEEPRTTAYRVLSFQYGSPGDLVLESAPAKPGAPDRGPVVFHRLTDGLEHVNRGEMPVDVAFSSLEQLQGLAGLSRYCGLLEVRNGTGPVPVTLATQAQIKKLLSNVVHSRGRVKGYLDAVNIHAEPYHATLYPVVGARKIRCVLDQAQLTGIGELLGAPVEVRGMLRFHPGAPHPFEVKVDSFERLGEPVRGIAGSMKGLTEGLTTLEYLEKLRNGEEAA